MNSSDSNVLVTAVLNPFRPLESRYIKRVDYMDLMTVLDAIHGLYPLVGDDLDVAISVNGKIVEDMNTRLQPADSVVFCLVPRGGGGDKNPLKMIAMIALVVVSAWAAGPLAASWASTLKLGAGATAVFSAGIGAAVSIAGGMLINALMPPSPMDLPEFGLDDFATASPTYGWSATSNSFREGVRWPVLYGTTRVKPPVISRYISSDGDKQFLNLLLAVADHACDSLADVEINGTPIAYFDEVTTEQRLGTLDQTPISIFDETVSQKVISQTVSAEETTRIVQTDGDSMTGIGVGLLLPRGLWHAADDGELEEEKIQFRLQYRAVGESTWLDFSTSEGGGLVTITGAQMEPIRRFYRHDGLSADQYEIRVQLIYGPADSSRYSGSLSYIEYISEHIDGGFSHPGCTLLAVRALATGQLNNSDPEITVLATRANVDTEAGLKPANNPAWQCYDAWVNSEYGEGLSISKVLWSEFNAWATACASANLESNLYVDTHMTLAQAISIAETIGRGRVIQRGTKIGCVVDAASSPVQLFTIGNIVEDSFSFTFVPEEERTNIVQVTYFDADRSYSRQTIQVVSPEFNPATDEAIIGQITLYGCTSRAQAVRHANFMLNCNRLLDRRVSFTAGIDSIACTVGDVIYVSFDAALWGQSGRVVSATSNTVTFDRKVTMEPGKTYKVMVRHQDDDSLEEHTVVGVASGGAEGDPIEDESGFVVTDESGETIRDEDTSASEYSTVTLSGTTWAKIPEADAVMSFGENNRYVRKFRVFAITRASNQRRTISALEYSENVYDDSTPLPDDDEYTQIDLVAGLTASEIRKTVGGQEVVIVHLAWRGAAMLWDVYYRSTGTQTWIKAGRTSNPWFDFDYLTPGIRYDFAVSVPGKSPADGEMISYTVGGWTEYPDPVWTVTGLRIVDDVHNGVWYGRDLKLAWNPVSDKWVDSAGEEAEGAGSYPPTEGIIRYRVRISNPDGVMRREEFVSDPSYIYTWEMNYEDGRGLGAANNMIVQVWARNRNNEESPAPAVLFVTNPAPGAVSGLSGSTILGGVQFTWAENSETDVIGYQYRYVVEQAQWAENWTGVTWQGPIAITEKKVIISKADKKANKTRVYFQVRAMDSFGSVSPLVASDSVSSDELFIVEGELADSLLSKINDNDDNPAMRSQTELLENQWTLKIQEDGYVTGMGQLLYHKWKDGYYNTGNKVWHASTLKVYEAIQRTNEEPPHADWKDLEIPEWQIGATYAAFQDVIHTATSSAYRALTATQTEPPGDHWDDAPYQDWWNGVYAVGEYVWHEGTDAVYKALTSTTNEPPHADWELIPNGARSEAIFLVDKFAIIQHDGVGGTKTPFVVGKINGVTSVGIDGDLLVDGSIKARHVGADEIDGDHINAHSEITLDEGGKAIFGQNNILIETEGDHSGRIVVAPNCTLDAYGNPSGVDYALFEKGDVQFYYWNGWEHVVYKNVRRIEVGDAVNGATVTIPGRWRTVPRVYVTPRELRTYYAVAPYDQQNQSIRCYAHNLGLIAGYTDYYKFQVKSELVFGQSSGSQAVSGCVVAPAQYAEPTYGWSAYQTAYTPTYTLPFGAVRYLTVNAYVKDLAFNFQSAFWYSRGLYYVIGVQYYSNGAWRSAGQVSSQGVGFYTNNHAFPISSPSYDVTHLRAWIYYTSMMTDLQRISDPGGGDGWYGHMGINKFDYTLTESTVLAEGSVNWIAIGD